MKPASSQPGPWSSKGSAPAHLLAAHPPAGHLEVVLAQAIRAQRVMRASLKQGPDRFLQFEDQIHIPCYQGRRNRINIPWEGYSSAGHLRQSIVAGSPRPQERWHMGKTHLCPTSNAGRDAHHFPSSKGRVGAAGQRVLSSPHSSSHHSTKHVHISKPGFPGGSSNTGSVARGRRYFFKSLVRSLVQYISEDGAA